MVEYSVNSIGIIGGTGKEGKGLAFRWAKAGYKIIIGSRIPEKAFSASKEIFDSLDEKGNITGMLNSEAAQTADIVVLTVPYAAHQTTLTDLKPFLVGKILIDVTVPLVPQSVTRVQMPAAGSAAAEAQNILGEHVMVVSAFQNISFENLLSNAEVDCDVLVCGNDPLSKKVVLELVQAAGLAGWDAGPLENSMVVEGLTSILIGINKRYKVHSSGIKITGVN